MSPAEMMKLPLCHAHGGKIIQHRTGVQDGTG